MDPQKEGKVTYEAFKQVMLHNPMDFWISESQINCLIEFLDPCGETEKDRKGLKIDYVTLLFQLEKP
jgi:hypothetical protein